MLILIAIWSRQTICLNDALSSEEAGKKSLVKVSNCSSPVKILHPFLHEVLYIRKANSITCNDIISYLSDMQYLGKKNKFLHLLKTLELFSCLKEYKTSFYYFPYSKIKMILYFTSFHLFFFNTTNYLPRFKYVNIIVHFHSKIFHLVMFIKENQFGYHVPIWNMNFITANKKKF